MPFARCLPYCFSLCLHAGIAGLALLFSNGSAPARETVYHVALADFARPSPPAGPVQAASEQAPPQPLPPLPPVKPEKPKPAAPKKKLISPRKQPAPTPKQAEEAAPPPPGRTAAAAVPSAPEAPAGGGGSATENGPRSVGGFSAYDTDKVDQRPAIARKIIPHYPVRAKRLDVQGQVVVRMVVDTSGRPRNCAVYSANPPGYFEEAALEAARKTRFVPGKVKGRAVNTLVLLPFAFLLR